MVIDLVWNIHKSPNPNPVIPFAKRLDKKVIDQRYRGINVFREPNLDHRTKTFPIAMSTAQMTQSAKNSKAVRHVKTFHHGCA